MAMVTLVEAARLTGLAALARAIRSGRPSPNRKEDGSYDIDADEPETSASRLQTPLPWRAVCSARALD